MSSNPLMSTSLRIPAHLTVAFTLSRLLQRLELSCDAVDAHQYRAVARRLAEELSVLPMDESLSVILKVHPSAGELYENLHYAQAGLCRAPLEVAVQTEQETRELLARLRRLLTP
jgi:hypothetical protein